jgi:hypothetical protein
MQELTPRAGEEETVDAVPVAEAHPVERRSPAGPVAVQAAAVAATGFVAGAATFAVLRRRLLRRRRRRGPLGPVVASRTFLVRVDVLGERGR